MEPILPVTWPSIEREWPELPYEEWADTYATLHRWTQIVGKTRLALSPMVNHWWQTTLYVSANGLTTSPIPFGERTFEVEFDFSQHLLGVKTNDGDTRFMPLVPQSVATFYRRYLSLLESLDISATIYPVPRELGDAIPFPEDAVHRSYDPSAVERWFQALVRVDEVMKAFRGNFVGKCSPVHFFWGAFDLACTRFSGRRAPPHPGGVPNCPVYVQREAYSHECISAGFWPGSDPVRTAAFYAYVYPEPGGLSSAAVRPREASYHPQLREFILPYDAVRSAPDPANRLLEFLDSTYDAAATLGGWDRASLAHVPLISTATR